MRIDGEVYWLIWSQAVSPVNWINSLNCLRFHRFRDAKRSSSDELQDGEDEYLYRLAR